MGEQDRADSQRREDKAIRDQKTTETQKDRTTKAEDGTLGAGKDRTMEGRKRRLTGVREVGWKNQTKTRRQRADVFTTLRSLREDWHTENGRQARGRSTWKKQVTEDLMVCEEDRNHSNGR